MNSDIKDAPSVIEARRRRISHDMMVVENNYRNMRNKTFKDIVILTAFALVGVSMMVFGPSVADGSALRNFAAALLVTWGFTVAGTVALMLIAKRDELDDIKYERAVFLKNAA